VKEVRKYDGTDQDLRLARKILIATRSYPPVVSGTSVIMKNFIDGFRPESVVLATRRALGQQEAGERPCRVQRFFVERETHLPPRVEKIRRYLVRPVVTRRIVDVFMKTDCGAILGVFPDFLFLDASERAARALGVPFFPYLHDTVAEAASSSRFAGWAQRIQDRVFYSAARVFVATGGMKVLYERKYNIDAMALVHIYPEPIPGDVPGEPAPRQALLWAGNAYAINSSSLHRVYQAMGRIGDLRMTMATGQSMTDLDELGFGQGLVVKEYVPVSERPRYLRLIRDHAVLVLALNWPDETHIHEDELATIFPTKTPEYLASGRPIIVHCPEHYHLARFIREHGCGEVVSERSVDAVEGALRRVLDSQERRRALGRAALQAAHLFAPRKVVPLFVGEVEKILADHRP